MKLTMSGLLRAQKCPASLWLPVVREVTHWARRGRALHEYLACRANGEGTDSALETIDPEFADECRAIEVPVGFFEGEKYAGEVAFAWDLKAGKARELHRWLGNRDYSQAADTELCGTADLVGLTDNEVVIWDLKTGWTDLGPPEENLQLLAYAVAAAKAYGRPRALVGYLLISEDGIVVPNQAAVDEFELIEAEEKIRAIVRSTEGPVYPEYYGVGEHCTYCPSFRLCPAQKTIALEFAGLERGLTLTHENAAHVYRRMKDVERLVDVVKSGLKQVAESGPIDLGDGRFYGPKDETVDTVDAKAAVALIPDLAFHAELKLTKESIKYYAAEHKADGQSKSEAYENLEAQLRQNGAIKAFRRVKVREYGKKGKNDV